MPLVEIAGRPGWQQVLVVPRRDRLLRDKNNENIVTSDLDTPREPLREQNVIPYPSHGLHPLGKLNLSIQTDPT